jgi:putative ABC transport system permease protein
MFSNFLKVALRHIRREKFYTMINIIGLTAGLMSCLLIGLYVFDEFNYDRFHDKKDRIVRLTMEFSQGDDINHWSVTGTKPGPHFHRTFPFVEAYTRMLLGSSVVGYREKIFVENKFLYADSSIFNIFTFPMAAGDAETALSSPDNIVITESMARKYFGEEVPIGKSLRLDGEKDFMVAGIVKDIPSQSQIQFDFLVSFNLLEAAQSEDWFPANYFTYLLLDEKIPFQDAEQKIIDYMKNINREELLLGPNEFFNFHMEPLKRVHLYSELGGLEPNGNITYIYILSLIALLILGIACINYTNLAIAQSTRRQKEMGMRKVLGAQQLQLFHHFMIESMILAGFSGVLALFLSYQILPYFNILTGKSLAVDSLFDPFYIGLLISLCFIVGFFSGIYPAFLYSKLKLIKVLRSGNELKVSSGRLGKSLIIFQFVISIFLILSTLIIQQQRAYIQEKNLGYDKENIVVLPIDRQVRPHYYALKDDMKQDPSVIQISAGYDYPTFIRWTNGITATTETGEKNFTSKAIPVDLDFLQTLGIKIIAGTDFTPADLEELKTSSGSENFRHFFIVNESAIRELGWNPDQAIGKNIECGFPGTIKAVVENFHIASFHDPISPLVIFLSNNFLNLMYVKIDGKNIPASLARLESIWNERIKNRPLDYDFLDDQYNDLYQFEQQSARFISTFAGLAILLACLGLFGLSAFMAVRRTKEIGIRKVLGASVQEIAFMLAREFLVMVGLACMIAIPIGWLAANKWLSGFAYHIEMEIWIFATAGLLALIITLVTISFQSIKASLANPVDSLRNE